MVAQDRRFPVNPFRDEVGKSENGDTARNIRSARVLAAQAMGEIDPSVAASLGQAWLLKVGDLQI